MQQLEALTRDAAALARGETAPVAEVARILEICNACRYCETFCAVFPAMTRRLSFDPGDVHYLANLCHNCGACLHACQYAAPHEFDVNVPRSMARVRQQTYTDYAWPPALGALYRRNGLTLALATLGGLTLFLWAVLALRGTLWNPPLAGNFYAIFPHNLLVALFGAALGWAVLALGIGAARFWRGQAPGRVPGHESDALPKGAVGEAIHNAMALTYLDGGHGDGCNEQDDRYTQVRRRCHHLTFYGFALCFASTCVATLYHYVLGLPAPYSLSSLPVLLGSVGGIGLVLGPIGLLRLNLQRHPAHGDAAQRPMDRAFIALLLAVSISGLALLAGRDGSAMALLLALHLGTVMALFLTLPYGKFAHAVYRVCALFKWSIERRLPNPLQLGGD